MKSFVTTIFIRSKPSILYLSVSANTCQGDLGLDWRPEDLGKLRTPTDIPLLNRKEKRKKLRKFLPQNNPETQNFQTQEEIQW